MMITQVDSELDRGLDKTGHSIRWILKALQQHCPEYVEAKGTSKVVSIEMSDVSAEKGYFSRVFITTLNFEDGQKFNIALKVPTFDILEEWIKGGETGADESEEAWKDRLLEAHNIECVALKLISPFNNFPAPRTYYTQKRGVTYDNGLSGVESPGIIIMSAINGTSLGLFSSATKEQCVSVAEDFAVFHDYIDQTDEVEWKNKYKSELHMGEHLREPMVKAILRIGEIFPEINQDCQILANMDFKSYSKYALKTRPEQLKALTLVHGDTWTNNIIFTKHSDGSIGTKVLAYIDFQTLFEGSVVFDIVRFISVCTDAEVRREAIPEVLKAYHSKLAELYEKRGKEVPFTIEAIQELYDLSFIHQAQNVALMARFFAERQKTNQEVAEAEEAKMNLRAKFALLDAVKLMKSRNLLEKFN